LALSASSSPSLLRAGLRRCRPGEVGSRARRWWLASVPPRARPACAWSPRRSGQDQVDVLGDAGLGCDAEPEGSSGRRSGRLACLAGPHAAPSRAPTRWPAPISSSRFWRRQLPSRAALRAVALGLERLLAVLAQGLVGRVALRRFGLVVLGRWWVGGGVGHASSVAEMTRRPRVVGKSWGLPDVAGALSSLYELPRGSVAMRVDASGVGRRRRASTLAGLPQSGLAESDVDDLAEVGAVRDRLHVGLAHPADLAGLQQLDRVLDEAGAATVVGIITQSQPGGAGSPVE
jgi:hypothetical protein